MSHKKHKIFNKSLFLMLALLLGVTGLVSTPQKTAIAHHATDCSDVFTPVSSPVMSGVNFNKEAYLAVQNTTGVPWEMLAAIHYRETSFSRTNPDNGQGIFQFVNKNGGPYPPGPVSETEFRRQLTFTANSIQNDYVNRGSVPRERRKLVPNEPNIAIVKDTLFSYNGRSQEYINQAAHFGYNTTTQPFEGSPYVMNRFDCPRARMGIITRDFGSLDGKDARYGAFTLYARLKGEAYWRALTLPYAWQFVGQASFTDSSRNNPIGTNTLRANQRIYLEVKARNIGNTTWQKSGVNPVMVGTSHPNDRQSRICDTTWPSCNRASNLVEASVAPGSIGTFRFWAKAPSSLGNYREQFNLLAEGRAWMNDLGQHWLFAVKGDTYNWQYRSQAVYSDVARTASVNPGTLAPNTTYYVRIQARNSGNTVWQRGNVNLGTSSPIDRISRLRDNSWISGNRASALKETSVAPGQVGTFEFSIRTPSAIGTYQEHFRAVSEGRAWLNDIGLFIPFTVRPATYSWQFQGQNVYSDSQKQQLADTTKVSNQTRLYAVLRAKNTGNTVWQRGNVNLGTSSPRDRTSKFCDSQWLQCNRPTTLTEASVAPGQVGTFEFPIVIPISENGTTLHEHFIPVAEGKAWMNDIGQHWRFNMQSSPFVWEHSNQALYTNAARTNIADTANLSGNTTYYTSLRARNTGGETWQRNIVRLGTSNPIDRTSIFQDNSWLGANRPAALKEASVAPGQIGTFEFSVRTPSSAGTYNEYFRPVADGRAWMNDLGQHWRFIVK